jgi:VanZ family protein
MIYAVLILSLSALSSTPAPDLGIAWEDKIYHFLEYLIFGILIFRAFPGLLRSTRKRLGSLLLILLGLAFAGFDETVQYFVPSRDSSFSDWLADAVGMIAAAGIYLWRQAKPKLIPDADEQP